ncbi:hypothetical protein [Parafilimonas sp.]|uniref:hypothetical protein n=1 Tax=Parafilimonas sp. TaxID=1969739 RepID=UPI0039E40B68
MSDYVVSQAETWTGLAGHLKKKQQALYAKIDTLQSIEDMQKTLDESYILAGMIDAIEQQVDLWNQENE